MCSLVVLRGFDANYPLVIAANRDERVARKAAPPGLWIGERRRMLSPRDRVAGGTWLAVDDRGRFAGITNLFGVPPVIDAPSRGHLPHLVLDCDRLDDGVATVLAKVEATAHSGFQLVAADIDRLIVIRQAQGRVEQLEWTEPVLQLSNEHQPGALALRRLSPALAADLPIEARLDALAAVLADPGGDRHHAVVKHGADYGTVSSSLIAVPARDPQRLLWRYAAGPPDVTRYRNYGNLGRRLLPDEPADR